MNLDKIIKENIDEFIITEVFGQNKYANIVKTAIMNLDTCLFYPQIEKVDAFNTSEAYSNMSSIFNTAHTLANQLANTLKQIQTTINNGKNVKESRLVEGPSISSLIPGSLRSWNPVRDFTVGAKKGMRAVDRMFNNNSKNYKTSSNKKTVKNTYTVMSNNLKSILDGILGDFQKNYQEFYHTYMSNKDVQKELIRFSTYIITEFRSCNKLLNIANTLRYSGIEKAKLV